MWEFSRLCFEIDKHGDYGIGDHRALRKENSVGTFASALDVRMFAEIGGITALHPGHLINADPCDALAASSLTFCRGAIALLRSTTLNPALAIAAPGMPANNCVGGTGG